MTATSSAHRRIRDARFAMHEMEADLEEVRALVRQRRVIAARGAGTEELRCCDAEIERHRREIAHLALLAAEPFKAA
jgi:hypothetical protein